jgi:hypothetical protein
MAAETPDDDAELEALLRGAERLCATQDALLRGQYEHLRARIAALIQLRRTTNQAA